VEKTTRQMTSCTQKALQTNREMTD
jgi:hypothetical protein